MVRFFDRKKIVRRLLRAEKVPPPSNHQPPKH
jgi:hypothetical protein